MFIVILAHFAYFVRKHILFLLFPSVHHLWHEHLTTIRRSIFLLITFLQSVIQTWRPFKLMWCELH